MYFQDSRLSLQIKAHHDAVYEGKDIKMSFRLWVNGQPNTAPWRTCYQYRTEEGTATEDRDYRPNSGTVCWDQQAHSSGTVKIKTLWDRLCENNETVKVVLTQPESLVLNEWREPSCSHGGQHWPCDFTATATIKQDSYTCLGRYR
ncbi:MAG: hypothetical protein OXF60_09130 [Gammaproteobacteria bacterium]|nr:hypothetical protein [Gammaproteobacteria bacterium]